MDRKVLLYLDCKFYQLLILAGRDDLNTNESKNLMAEFVFKNSSLFFVFLNPK